MTHITDWDFAGEGEFYGRVVSTGERIGPYASQEELNDELRLAEHEAQTRQSRYFDLLGDDKNWL